MRKLTHEEIVARQQQRSSQPKLPLCVLLNNIRSLYNVGSIFRTADAVGIEKLWICGITGHPPNKQIEKTALGAEKNVLWEYREDAPALVKELKSQGYQIVLLEQAQESCSYEDLDADFPVCLILGNEISGASPSLVPLCDKLVEIDMAGLKNSLNVSVAFGVAAFDIRRKLNKKLRSTDEGGRDVKDQ